MPSWGTLIAILGLVLVMGAVARLMISSNRHSDEHVRKEAATQTQRAILSAHDAGRWS